MQFRVLGTLEVLPEGVPVAVGGPKPRALLAVLLVQAGTVVSTDRLIQAVWGDEPPADALAVLRSYVSRLRTALGPPARLLSRAPGYLLEVAEEELDAAQFARLLGTARAQAEADDHGGVVSTLDAALALWRGEALAEFASLDFAVAEVARLDELRQVAVETRIDALLHLDREAEVLGELEGLVRRFPTRERLAVQLMRGLYRSGRQTEALGVYQQLRRRLVDELGVEPSAQAQQLHRQVLAHDAVLEHSRAAPGSLRRRATSFVGRDAELLRLVAVTESVPLLTLTGVGGVGKSRLALELADRTRARYPDGTWVCELAPLPVDGPVSHAVAAALGVQQRPGLSIEQTVTEFLRARALLLVLDNCEHVLPAAARLVAGIMPQCPGVTVLCTSREALGVDGEQVWPVPPLSADEATTLFVQRARSTRPDFHLDGETGAAVSEICLRLDRLPLGIELAAARMRMMSAGEVVRRLDDSQLLLVGRPRSAQPRHQSLTAAVDWSYRLLAPGEQRLFVMMSVFAGGADLAGVHGVCAESGSTDSEVLELLTGLVDKSMVVATPGTSGTRYRMLETLRSHGGELLRERGEEVALARRHAEYFAGLAERAAHGVQGPDEQVWVASTLPDRDNLRVAVDRAFVDQREDVVLRLVTSLAEVLHLRVGYESASWAERALDVAPRDSPLFAACVGAAARGAWNRGDFARARRVAAQAGGSVPGRGTARIAYPADVVADIALYEGDTDTALSHWEAEVLAARGQDDPVRLVWTLYYVAICHAVRREPRYGVAAARESVEVADRTGNPTARSMARYALGLVGKKADPDRALALFDEAAALAGQVHNSWWRGIAMMEAAATRAVHGDPTGAARALVEVLDHWDRVGDWTQQWLNLRYVVRLLARLGAVEEAAALHRCLVSAGKPSPLHDLDREPVARPGPPLSGLEAVALARATLRRWAWSREGSATAPGLQERCNEAADARPLTHGRPGVDMTGTLETRTDEADRALKAKHRAMWALGDYPAVAAEVIPSLGAVLTAACDVAAGQDVLDVAAGSGNAALPAALAGADVVASDLTPELFADGRARATARGVDVEWVEADAEALPFADGRFDVVLSCVGVMFAPHHQAAADQLVRVCRPGGRIGLLSWTPAGFIGQMFATMKPFAPPPPPGAQPPPLWGDPEHVRALLGDRVTEVTALRQAVTVDRFATPAQWLDYFKTNYGPTIAVYRSIAADPARVAELDRALIAFATPYAGDGGAMQWEYLLLTARRT